MDKAPDAYRTISEVAEDLDLPQHVLRFWETRFAQIKPLKRGGGRRYYRPDDVELLKGIRYLLYKEGYTIKGVQRILKENGVRAVQAFAQPDPVHWAPEGEMPPSLTAPTPTSSAPQVAAPIAPMLDPQIATPPPASSPLAVPPPASLALAPVWRPPLMASAPPVSMPADTPDREPVGHGGGSLARPQWSGAAPLETPPHSLPAPVPPNDVPQAAHPGHVSMFRGGIQRAAIAESQALARAEEAAFAELPAPQVEDAVAAPLAPPPNIPPPIIPPPEPEQSSARGFDRRQHLQAALYELGECRAAIGALLVHHPIKSMLADR